MGRLIIHIGTHKTGTTSIQRTLYANRERLSRRGILYPDYAVVGLKPHYAHIGMANALASDHPEISPDVAGNFLQTVARMAQDHEATLISAEPMYRQTLGDTLPQEAPDESAYWSMRDAYIRRVRELAGAAEIALVVRRQCDFAESMYQEHVKVTRYGGSFVQFLDEFWFHFRYLDQYMAWKRHFDQVRVVPFDAIRGDQIARAFLVRLDLRPGRLAALPSQNVSLPHDAVILKREFNQTALGRAELARLAAAMSEEFFRAEIIPGRRSFFASADDKLAFQASHDESNNRLGQMTGVGEPSLFPGVPERGGIYGDRLPNGEGERLKALLDSLTRQSREAESDSSVRPASHRRARRARLAARAAAVEASADSSGPMVIESKEADPGVTSPWAGLTEPATPLGTGSSEFSSAQYWESRYRRGGNSGAGSYGRLADFKALVLNSVLASIGASSVVDFGCGDGNQLAGLNVPQYLGVDVSPTAIDLCCERWAADAAKSFMVLDAYDNQPREADVALSLDVIFHLVEDAVFHRYMQRLFVAARRLVVIYSADTDEPASTAPHVRLRAVTPWVERHAPGWMIWRHIANAYPFDPSKPDETSLCDFYIFRRRALETNE